MARKTVHIRRSKVGVLVVAGIAALAGMGRLGGAAPAPDLPPGPGPGPAPVVPIPPPGTPQPPLPTFKFSAGDIVQLYPGEEPAMYDWVKGRAGNITGWAIYQLETHTGPNRWDPPAIEGGLTYQLPRDIVEARAVLVGRFL